MAAGDVSAAVAAIVAKIRSVDGVGQVWPYDVWADVDIGSRIVSDVDGEATLRAWWVTGPAMSSQRLTQSTAGIHERSWAYTLVGIEGMVDETRDGDIAASIDTLRDKALAVTDALDADPRLAGTVHWSGPTIWSRAPAPARLADVVVARVELRLDVRTVSTP